MNRFVLFGVTSLIIGVAGAADQPDLATLSWMAGCWSEDGAERGTVEQWMPLAGDTYMGMSRTVKNGKTHAWEFLQIRRDAQGAITYVALPSHQSEAIFTAIKVTGSEAVFENLAHDFPQRVMYHLLSQDKLMARIEGMRNGELKGIDYPMHRTSCDGLVKAGG